MISLGNLRFLLGISLLSLFSLGVLFGNDVYAQFASTSTVPSLAIEAVSESNTFASTTPASMLFAIGEHVVLSKQAKIRSAPSFGETVVTTQASSTSAIVIGEAVRSGDSIFWNVQFDSGVSGWVSESVLVSLESPTQKTATYSPEGETKITNTPAHRSEPQISGDKIVWIDDRNGTSDIYLYDLASHVEERLTTGSGNETQPSISGTKVVYVSRQEDQNNTGHDSTVVYLLDLTTHSPQPLAVDARFQSQPVISGDFVAYVQTDGAIRTIHLYNLITTTNESIATGSDISHLRIAGNYLVWMDMLGGSWKSYAYNIETKKQSALANHSGDQMNPAVSSDGKAVVMDRHGGNAADDWHIALTDLKTGETTLVTKGTAHKPTDLAISGNRISWARDGEIFLYDLVSDTETQLTQEPGERTQLALDGTTLVWLDQREGTDDIRVWQIK